MTIEETNITFLYPPAFDKEWKKCGLTHSDKEELESILTQYKQQKKSYWSTLLRRHDSTNRRGNQIKI